MPISDLRLIMRSIEFVPRDQVMEIPRKIRGLYVLYRKRKYKWHEKFDVAYVGIAFGKKVAGVHGRIRSHRNKDKGLRRKLWTHFSIFQVWPNVGIEEVRELEGILRHIYRKDSHANRLNKLVGFNKLRKNSVRVKTLKDFAESVV